MPFARTLAAENSPTVMVTARASRDVTALAHDLTGSAAPQLPAAASQEIASGSRLPFTHPLLYRSLGAARPALSAR